MMRSHKHTAHTHTTNLKPSIAPIKVPSSALLPLTSSREQVATDNVEAPPHRCESKGRRLTAPRRHRLCHCSQRHCMNELRLMMPRGLVHAIRGQQTAPDDLVIVAHRGQPSTNGAEMPRHQEYLRSEDEEVRVSRRGK